MQLSSMGGQMSCAGFSAYSATKFALEGLSEALAEEVAGLEIMRPGQGGADAAATAAGK